MIGKPPRNPIEPLPLTPAGVAEYQKQQPWPDWQTVYEKYRPDGYKLLRRYLEENGAGNFGEYQRAADNQARQKADAIVKTGTTLSWDDTRFLVWVRDKGACDVCGDVISLDHYECGHIVDRVCGGTDRLDNLVVMCILCNRIVKDLHNTREEYDAWKATRPFERFMDFVLTPGELA